MGKRSRRLRAVKVEKDSLSAAVAAFYSLFNANDEEEAQTALNRLQILV